MKKTILILLSLLFVCTTYASSSLPQEEQIPVGFWKTIDDVTGQPKAIVQVFKTSNQSLFGRVLKIYPRKGLDPNPLCVACDGTRHNQRVIGMIILENFRQNKDHLAEWGGGKILDPKNGKIYRSNMRLTDGGKKLNVRGYVGLPLFGRSQTWERTENPSKA